MNPEIMVASYFESNNCRRLAEEICATVFLPLPYSACGIIGHRNEQMFFDKKDIDEYERQFSRPFPQGSIGIRLEKSMHDDRNGFFSPGLWQCLAVDPLNEVALRFHTVTTRFQFESSTGRFATFNGLMPHEAKVVGKRVPSPYTRVHHSSYWKTEHEHIAQVLMAPEFANDLFVKVASDGTSISAEY